MRANAAATTSLEPMCHHQTKSSNWLTHSGTCSKIIYLTRLDILELQFVDDESQLSSLLNRYSTVVSPRSHKKFGDNKIEHLSKACAPTVKAICSLAPP